MENELTDLEKQQLLATFYVHKMYAPGLDRLAQRIVESIDGVKERESAMLQLSYYLAAYGNFALAEEVARKRLAGYARASALAVIATEIAKDDLAMASSFLQDAEMQLTEARDSDERAILLQQISLGYASMNNWRRATELANRISPVEDKVSTLCEIAKCLWATGEVGEAKRILADAYEVAKGVEVSERTGALSDVAKVLVQMDRKAEAVQVWEEGVSFADHSAEADKWVLSICQAFVSLGHKDRAYEIANAIRNEARRTQALTALKGLAG